VNEVRKFGYCSVDTEGSPPTLIQFASPRGTVVYWSPKVNATEWRLEESKGRYKSHKAYNFTDLPDTLKQLLKDEYIIKIQSDIFNDKRKLEAAGLKINSCVDLRLIYILHPLYDGAKCGMEAIIKNCIGQPYINCPWATLWTPSEINHHAKAMKHMCQDVRAAIVGLYAVVEKFFTQDGGDNMMPLLYQFLFMYLDIDRDPNKFSSPEKPLTANTDQESAYFVHPMKTVNFLMDTSPYFTKVSTFSVRAAFMPPSHRRLVARRPPDKSGLSELANVNWEDSDAAR